MKIIMKKEKAIIISLISVFAVVIGGFVAFQLFLFFAPEAKGQASVCTVENDLHVEGNLDVVGTIFASNFLGQTNLSFETKTYDVGCDDKCTKIVDLHGSCALVIISPHTEDGSGNCYTVPVEYANCTRTCWIKNPSEGKVGLAMNDPGLGAGKCKYRIVAFGCETGAADWTDVEHNVVVPYRCGDQGGMLWQIRSY